VVAQIELFDPVRAAVNAADGFFLALFLHLVALLIVFGYLESRLLGCFRLFRIFGLFGVFRVFRVLRVVPHTISSYKIPLVIFILCVFIYIKIISNQHAVYPLKNFFEGSSFKNMYVLLIEQFLIDCSVVVQHAGSVSQRNIYPAAYVAVVCKFEYIPAVFRIEVISASNTDCLPYATSTIIFYCGVIDIAVVHSTHFCVLAGSINTYSSRYSVFGILNFDDRIFSRCISIN